MNWHNALTPARYTEYRKPDRRQAGVIPLPQIAGPSGGGYYLTVSTILPSQVSVQSVIGALLLLLHWPWCFPEVYLER